jgi:hypothetical protein
MKVQSIINRLFVFFFISVLTIISCYHYTFNPNLPSNIEKITIPIFNNETLQYGIESTITQDVIDEFISDGTLDVVEKEKSDAILWGTIRKYRIDPVGFDKNEVVDEYRLLIEIEVKLEDATSKEILWEETDIKESTSFFPNRYESGLNNSETEAFNEVSQYLSLDIMRLTVEGWW